MFTALLMILYLAFLEILLSLDNALVLATLVKNNISNPEERKKALQYGIWGAYIFRIIIVFAGVWLVSFSSVKIIAALYLAYISIKELFFKKDEKIEDKKDLPIINNFWKIVCTIELMDLAFSVDSIAVGLSVSTSKIILILGAIIGITAMRYSSVALIKVIEKYPSLEKVAFVLVLLAAFKIILGVGGYEITEGNYILLSIMVCGIYLFLKSKYNNFKENII